MKLLTKEIMKKLPKLRSTSKKKPDQVQVICKFFQPWGAASWFITEGEKQSDGDWLLFGYVTGMAEDELGYVSLNELQSLHGPFGLKIERDISFGPATLADVMEGRAR